MARPKPELVLSEDERQVLTKWANRPKSTQRLALRAHARALVSALARQPRRLELHQVSAVVQRQGIRRHRRGRHAHR